MFTLGKNNSLISFLNHEKLGGKKKESQKLYVLNVAIYVANSAWLEKSRTFISEETLAYLMPPSRSLDIDTEWDMTVLENLLKAKQNA